jgi:hypothetical protein
MKVSRGGGVHVEGARRHVNDALGFREPRRYKDRLDKSLSGNTDSGDGAGRGRVEGSKGLVRLDLGAAVVASGHYLPDLGMLRPLEFVLGRPNMYMISRRYHSLAKPMIVFLTLEAAAQRPL